MIDLPVVPAVTEVKRKPDWLRVKLPVGKEYAQVRSLVDTHKLTPFAKAAIALIWANAGVQVRQPL